VPLSRRRSRPLSKHSTVLFATNSSRQSPNMTNTPTPTPTTIRPVSRICKPPNVSFNKKSSTNAKRKSGNGKKRNSGRWRLHWASKWPDLWLSQPLRHHRAYSWRTPLKATLSSRKGPVGRPYRLRRETPHSLALRKLAGPLWAPASPQTYPPPIPLCLQRTSIAARHPSEPQVGPHLMLGPLYLRYRNQLHTVHLHSHLHLRPHRHRRIILCMLLVHPGLQVLWMHLQLHPLATYQVDLHHQFNHHHPQIVQVGSNSSKREPSVAVVDRLASACTFQVVFIPCTAKQPYFQLPSYSVWWMKRPPTRSASIADMKSECDNDKVSRAQKGARMTRESTHSESLPELSSAELESDE
jgi:hypothetical protein